MTGTRFTIEVQPNIPDKLSRLTELSNDLLYSWDRSVRGLFFRLDRELWEECGHNPKVFLRRVSQERLESILTDRIFMEDYNRVLSVYDTYHREPMRPEVMDLLDADKDLIAYFCAEFGFHESFPIYSGGLGILAGDHCKAASDLGIPFVGVGLLYRQGYFTQTIDARGNQIAHYNETNFSDLPVKPAYAPDGSELLVNVDILGHDVKLKVWQVTAGHITVYLLDSDLAENSDEKREITHQLYGGDINTRIQQEIVLGIGGTRALRALGFEPTVWHINEGHAAFMTLERIREYVEDGMDFDSALELVASGTVFTTHTPVSAGHDIFNHDLFTSYFKEYARTAGISMDHLFDLGESLTNHGGFNMTALALRTSRFHNGVSRIHGSVASQMEGYVWPQIPHEENPIGYVTNGVHVPTFLAREWVTFFDMRFDREWRNELLNEEYWQRIDEIPDQGYWSVRQTLKSELFVDINRRVKDQLRRNGHSEVHIERITALLTSEHSDILTLGFARRFATYKRATLLFDNPQRLERLLNNPDRPVILIFAGKAHPSDLPGQELIRTIHEYSLRPEFEGKIILLEDYDLALARKLVSGVDVWVNNPIYPLEASGTSGQKAGINGVINLSVLDGWWGEGYNGENGWAIRPHGPDTDAKFRDREEGQSQLDILEEHVIPAYYNRAGHGYSEEWVRISKASMKSIIPNFGAQRMLMDYLRNYYHHASKHHAALLENDSEPARVLSAWKNKVGKSWKDVALYRLDIARHEIKSGEILPVRVAARLNGLDHEDIQIECLIGKNNHRGEFIITDRFYMEPTGENSDNGDLIYEVGLHPSLPGLQQYMVRMYPYHSLLAHPFETGWMIWL